MSWGDEALELFDVVVDWLYEFRILIIALALVICLLTLHNCQFRISLDSRSTQGGPETAGSK